MVYSKLRNISQGDSISSCLGLEVYFGKQYGFVGTGDLRATIRRITKTKWREYQQLGEIAYTQKKFHEGLAFIRSHRLLYVQQTARRVVYLWTGFWSLSPRYLREEPADLFNIVSAPVSQY